MDPLQRINELERRYDRAVPPDLLAIASIGSPELVAVMQQIATVEFYKNLTIRQIEAIRARRADGSYYSSMIADLKFYRRYHRAHRRHLLTLQRIVAQQQTAPLAA